MSSRQIPVTFTFRRSGVEPPLFVAGNFSDPPWHPYEMDASIDQHGDFVFTKQIMVNEASDIQYKFRHATGDWWALDPEADTTTDSQGNVNSVLHFPARYATQEASAIKDADESKAPSTAQPSQVATADRSADTSADNLAFANAHANRAELRRLSLPPMDDPAKTAAEVADSASLLDEDEDKDELETEASSQDVKDDMLPLFSHERLVSTDEEQPLKNEGADVRRESLDHPAENLDDSSMDLDDPLLEQFPTDRDSIIATVRRLSTTVPVDPTTVDVAPLSPVFNASKDPSPSADPASLSVDDAASHGQQDRRSATHRTSGTSLQSIDEDDEVTKKEGVDRRNPSMTSSNSPGDEGASMGESHPNLYKVSSDGSANYVMHHTADDTAAANSTPRSAEHSMMASASSASIDPTVSQKPVNTCPRLLEREPW